MEERTFWYSTTSSASVANDGRLALLDASLITASSSLAEVANATATYMVQPAPDSDSPDLAFICPFACGPFVFSQNGYEPLRVRRSPSTRVPPSSSQQLTRSPLAGLRQTFMKSTSVLSTVYSLLVENAITLFVIALILMVAYQFRSNTLIVAQVRAAAVPRGPCTSLLSSFAPDAPRRCSASRSRRSRPWTPWSCRCRRS